MMKHGFMGIPVPKQYGGQGCDPLMYVMCVEELSKSAVQQVLSYPLILLLLIHPIMTYGTEEQKKKYLPDLCKWYKTWAHSV